jgi:hypothetical protein
VGLNSLKSLNLTNGYPNKNKNNNNKVKSKPLELRSRVKNSREKKKFWWAVNFWLKISSNLGQMKGTLFAPNSAPSMQNRNSLTPPHICT